jgi:hypothetical protein
LILFFISLAGSGFPTASGSSSVWQDNPPEPATTIWAGDLQWRTDFPQNPAPAVAVGPPVNPVPFTQPFQYGPPVQVVNPNLAVTNPVPEVSSINFV